MSATRKSSPLAAAAVVVGLSLAQSLPGSAQSKDEAAEPVDTPPAADAGSSGSLSAVPEPAAEASLSSRIDALEQQLDILLADRPTLSEEDKKQLRRHRAEVADARAQMEAIEQTVVDGVARELVATAIKKRGARVAESEAAIAELHHP